MLKGRMEVTGSITVFLMYFLILATALHAEQTEEDVVESAIGLLKRLLKDQQNGPDKDNERESPDEGPECAVGEFMCTNGRCIPNRSLCDLQYDCWGDDRSDEDPYICKDYVCPDDMYACAGGLYCLKLYRVCDKHNSCPEGDDERDCERKPCKVPSLCAPCDEESFQCDNDRCINKTLVCNNRDNCWDNSDELQCTHLKCKSAQDFKCGRSDRCVDRKYLCNRQNNCGDWSDEKERANCPLATACDPDYEVPCGIVPRCIAKWYVCDGDDDCHDNTDEMNCNGTWCNELAFLCNNNNCVSLRQRCNGDDDCGDSSDEMNCNDYATCGPKQFKCDTSPRCFTENMRCDNDLDCDDGTDEKGCPCDEGYFKCDNNKCIDQRYVCDDWPSCPFGDGSDEKNCSHIECKPNHFKCKTGARCVRSSYVCNKFFDCQDHSDEKDCPSESPERCESNQFRCEDDHRCISNIFLCDKIKDCRDGSDEKKGCIPQCKHNEKRCADQKCLSKDVFCDGRQDCSDGSDEEDCSDVTCQPGEIKCEPGYLCVPNYWKCDGDTDCDNGFDEADCDDN